MSGQALIWAANVRGLKPATKIVLIQLAERHNKDTGLCNPSIRTLADDCEMDRTTVMRHIAVLESLGLVTTQSAGNDDGGRANNQYQLHMPKTEPTDVSRGVKSDFATGVKSQSDGGLSRNPTGVKSHSCATLTYREPIEEPTLFGSIEPQREVREAEKPKKASRLSSDWSLPDDWFGDAVALGVDPDRISREADKFRDYWVAKPGKDGVKQDWRATWRNWMRRVAESIPQPPRDDDAERRRRRLMGPQFGEIVR